MAATPVDLEFVVSVINEMNRVIANHKTSYTQSQAQKKANQPEESETVENWEWTIDNGQWRPAPSQRPVEA